LIVGYIPTEFSKVIVDPMQTAKVLICNTFIFGKLTRRWVETPSPKFGRRLWGAEPNSPDKTLRRGRLWQ